MERNNQFNFFDGAASKPPPYLPTSVSFFFILISTYLTRLVLTGLDTNQKHWIDFDTIYFVISVVLKRRAKPISDVQSRHDGARRSISSKPSSKRRIWLEQELISRFTVAQNTITWIFTLRISSNIWHRCQPIPKFWCCGAMCSTQS